MLPVPLPDRMRPHSLELGKDVTPASAGSAGGYGPFSRTRNDGTGPGGISQVPCRIRAACQPSGVLRQAQGQPMRSAETVHRRSALSKSRA